MMTHKPTRIHSVDVGCDGGSSDEARKCIVIAILTGDDLAARWSHPAISSMATLTALQTDDELASQVSSIGGI